MKGYMRVEDMKEIFRGLGYTFKQTQFDTVFSVLDKNRAGDINYKQMLEYILGPEDANKLFTGAALGYPGATNFGKAIADKKAQFIMPI